jgi:hypothetical protein
MGYRRNACVGVQYAVLHLKSKIKNNMRIHVIIAAAAIAGLTACSKGDSNNTDHPAYAQIISLTTDWSDRGEGIAIPDPYTVTVGDWSAALHGTDNAVENLFPAGTYRINVWNEAASISVSGGTATADYSAGTPLGWFFTGTQDVTLEHDRDYSFTVAMHQQVRELTLALEPAGDAKDRIAGIDATLSGVAGAITIADGNPAGAAVTVALAFESRTDGKYYTTIRLLGIAGSEQTLTFTLHFADGNPSTHTLTADLSDKLAAFNADRKTPLTLAASLTVTSSLAGISATIDEWTDNDGNIIAD